MSGKWRRLLPTVPMQNGSPSKPDDARENYDFYNKKQRQVLGLPQPPIDNKIDCD